jgi:hypothetical protein
VTAVPVDSRTTVPGLTQQGLTSGFGMGPGKHLRYDRAPISFRIGSGRSANARWEHWHELVDEGHSRCKCTKKMLERLVPLD